MFEAFFKNKKTEQETIKFEPSEEVNTNTVKEEKIKETDQQEEWIWVEGYKGTDKNMMCRDVQYELNKTFKYEGKISLCDSGFHFCKYLNDVFGYYDLLNGNRFFKVKALVKRAEYRSINNQIYSIYGYSISDSKMVAKEIILLKELDYKDLKRSIEKRYPMIETEEEYMNCADYGSLCKHKFLSKMKKLGFSELFSQIQYDDIESEADLLKYLRHAEAYQEENISKDMMIYYLEKYKNKLDNE